MHVVEQEVFVLFIAVGSVRFFHCSHEIVYFLWPCFGLSTFYTS